MAENYFVKEELRRSAGPIPEYGVDADTLAENTLDDTNFAEQINLHEPGDEKTLFAWMAKLAPTCIRHRGKVAAPEQEDHIQTENNRIRDKKKTEQRRLRRAARHLLRCPEPSPACSHCKRHGISSGAEGRAVQRMLADYADGIRQEYLD